MTGVDLCGKNDQWFEEDVQRRKKELSKVGDENQSYGWRKTREDYEMINVDRTLSISKVDKVLRKRCSPRADIRTCTSEQEATLGAK